MSTLRYSEIDPEYKKILTDSKYITSPPFTESIKRRAEFNALAKAVADSQPVPPGLKINDRQIPSSSPDVFINIRTYIPDTKGPNPLVFWMYGGGFATGSLDSQEANRRDVAAELGVSIVCPEYRLAPEFPFPIGLNDAYAALNWASTNDREFNADVSKGFIIAGASSGANFAAALALRARDDPNFGAKLTGQVLHIPVLSHPDAYPEKYKDQFLSYEQNAHAPLLTKADLITMYNNYNAPPTSSEFNVVLAPSHTGLPPTYFQVAGLDPLRDDGIVYEQVLREAGVKTRIEVYPGVPHGYTRRYPQLRASQKWRADQMNGIRWLLGQESADN